MIDQVLSIQAPDLQLVVQDNSDTDALASACKKHALDGRLKYQHTPGAMSFVANFSAGVESADGEYVCIIGDDDGINPEIIDVARWASQAGVSAVKPGLQAIYWWPDSGCPNRDATGELWILPVLSEITVHETAPVLEKFLRNGCMNYLNLPLAKLYHGLIRRDSLERVRGATGHYFGGLSPDIYSAVALSIVINEVVCIDYPLTISGICKNSGSADSATGRHTGSLEDAPHFRGNPSYSWAQEVPGFYCVETIWADSSLAAVKEMRRDDLMSRYRLEALTAHCLSQHPEYRKSIMLHYWNSSRLKRVPRLIAATELSIARLKLLLRWPVESISSRLRRRKHGAMQSLTSVRDINAAAELFSRHMAESGIDVHRCIGNLDSR